MFSKDVIGKVVVLANSLSVEPATLLAVGEVESAGVSFWTVNGEKLPAIRFEGHYFYKRLSGAKLKAAIKAGLAAPTPGAVKNPSSYSARYALLERAAKIDRDAAYESTSWGLGQVMGAHWAKLGYRSVEDLVATAKRGVDGQIEIMARYIQKFGLVDELQRKGWQSFADQYNGPASRKNRYSEKIANAYKLYSKLDYAHTGVPAEKVDAVVRQIQSDLKRLGYFKGSVDGIDGKATKEAVRAFQKANGLVADGKYGKMTDEAVDRAIAALDTSKGDSAVKAGTSVTGTGAITEVLSDQASKLDSVAQYSHVITYVVTALVVVGVALTLYGLWKKYKSQGTVA